jgi:acetyl-CoA C-acetyltransferase
MTVNRACGSGAQAIVSAAQEILIGSVDTAIAGGMENMDADQGIALALEMIS